MLEGFALNTGKIVTFDKDAGVLKVEWPKLNPLTRTMEADPDPLLIPFTDIETLIFARDEPSTNLLFQDYAIKIQEKDTDPLELLAGDSRLVQVVHLINEFIGLDFVDQSHLDPAEYGFNIQECDELPPSSKIVQEQMEDAIILTWSDKSDSLKFWGYFLGFTIFYVWFVHLFFARDLLQLTLALFVWILIFRMILTMPKVNHSKLIIAPEYLSFRRSPHLSELVQLPKLSHDKIKTLRLTMVTHSHPGIEVLTPDTIYWIGYDLSEMELGYIYALMKKTLSLKNE